MKKQIKEEGPVAANCMGDGRGIATVDPLLVDKISRRLKSKIKEKSKDLNKK